MLIFNVSCLQGCTTKKVLRHCKTTEYSQKGILHSTLLELTLLAKVSICADTMFCDKPWQDNMKLVGGEIQAGYGQRMLYYILD